MSSKKIKIQIESDIPIMITKASTYKEDENGTNHYNVEAIKFTNGSPLEIDANDFRSLTIYSSE